MEGEGRSHEAVFIEIDKSLQQNGEDSLATKPHPGYVANMCLILG